MISALESLQTPVRSIVEIGVNQGDCSWFLRQCFPSAHLYLVDPWELSSSYRESDGPVTLQKQEMRRAFNKVQSYFRDDPYTHVFRKTSKEASFVIPDFQDLVFIDGNHDYEFVKEDIELWLPKIRNGGILAGHDYHIVGDDFPGVKRAVDESFGDDVVFGKNYVWLHFKK